MLVLSRRQHEQIQIGDDIVITIVTISRGRVVVGIDAPKDVPIVRPEAEATSNA